jgi:hypothetical protein
MNNFYRQEVSEDLKRLRDAIITEKTDVVNLIEEKYHRILPSDISLPNRSFISKEKLDTFSSCLLPCDIPHHLTPVKATGDGDCFYHSASILLTGDQRLTPVLRILIAAEIFLHDRFYAKHPR